MRPIPDSRRQSDINYWVKKVPGFLCCQLLIILVETQTKYQGTAKGSPSTGQTVDAKRHAMNTRESYLKFAFLLMFVLFVSTT